MIRAAAALVALAALAALVAAREASAQDAPPERRVDPRALELVRKADRTTYRPTAAGLKSLRCRADYVMTNGIRYRMAYVMEAPGKSTIALQTSETDEPDPWSESDRMRTMLDELFDGPRLETRLAAASLEWKEIDARPTVVARETTDDAPTDYRFLPEGPLDEADPKTKFERVRTTLKYERAGDVFVRKSARLEGQGNGSMWWKYEDFGGVKLPVKYGAFLGGLGGTLTITDVEVNVPVTGPATLPPPPAPPTQDELDALDVPSLVAKLRAPFVGKEPNAVTMLRLVRAFAKKGDDAKRAIPDLVRLLALDRADAPKHDAPADFVEFHDPLAELLAKLRPESIRPLIGALRSPIVDQREWAAQTLGRMGKDAAPAIDALVAAIDDDMWFVGLNAAVAARKAGCPAERALPPLLRQAASQFTGESYAGEAVEYAKADPDGDRKLVAAFVAGGCQIERRDDGKPRGVEFVFRKDGARLAPLLAEAAKSDDAPRRENLARALVVSGGRGLDVLATWLDGADDGLVLAALHAAAFDGALAAPLAAKIVARLDAAPTAADAADAAVLAVGAAAVPHLEAFVVSRPADDDDPARARARRLLERLRTK